MPFNRNRTMDSIMITIALLLCIIGVSINRLTHGKRSITIPITNTNAKITVGCVYNGFRICYQCNGFGCDGYNYCANTSYDSIELNPANAKVILYILY